MIPTHGKGVIGTARQNAKPKSFVDAINQFERFKKMNDYPQDPRTPPRVRVPITKYEEVYLDCHQEKEVAISYFCKKFKLNPDYYIKDDYVVHTYEVATSHRSNVTDKIREATEEDIILYSMLSKLRKGNVV